MQLVASTHQTSGCLKKTPGRTHLMGPLWGKREHSLTIEMCGSAELPSQTDIVALADVVRQQPSQLTYSAIHNDASNQIEAWPRLDGR
jgi:hypothetical protein